MAPLVAVWEIVGEYVLFEIVALRNSSFADLPGSALAGKLAVPYLPDGSALPSGGLGV
ncbi:hypothetical protein [Mycobacterium leprae]|uniref:hypothetical protein n=1 Tax=Mycobacterium leprae TaxID=1769 RepID=UPI0002EA12A3|nr:hypothetical protein [Mycobacterium leprae]